MIRNSDVRILVACLALFATTACDNGPAGPDTGLTMNEIAGRYGAYGDYGALELTTLADGETVDWLAAGGSVDLTLSADGTTAGSLHVPGADENGSDFEADLAGSWTLVGDTVRFEQAADTFIRDVPLAVEGSTLVGDRSFGEVRVRMVLRRE